MERARSVQSAWPGLDREPPSFACKQIYRGALLRCVGAGCELGAAARLATPTEGTGGKDPPRCPKPIHPNRPSKNRNDRDPRRSGQEEVLRCALRPDCDGGRSHHSSALSLLPARGSRTDGPPELRASRAWAWDSTGSYPVWFGKAQSFRPPVARAPHPQPRCTCFGCGKHVLGWRNFGLGAGPRWQDEHDRARTTSRDAASSGALSRLAEGEQR